MEVDNDQSNELSGNSIGCSFPKIQVPVTCFSLNLTQYIDRYDGYTKLQRLLFIADKCPNLQEDAYRLLLNELKRGSNTAMYLKVYEQVGAAVNCGAEFDREWVETVENRESIKLERLEAELMAAKTTMVKESIRLSFNDIGDLHYERGNLSEAMKSYLRTRDYCTIPKHNLDLCARVVSVSMDLNQFGNVNFYVTKAESTAGENIPSGAIKENVMSSKIKAAAALVLLIEGQYKGAAKKFLEVGWNVGESFSTIIAPEDIAVYGTLCALATLERSVIRKTALENTVFKSFLELVPDIKYILNSFFAGKYGDCLSYLARIESELKLDVHLSRHVEPLISQITERMILLYFSPYSSVDMNRMAVALNMNIVQLEKSVAALIACDKIPARIDSQSKTLHRRQHDVRSVTIEKVERLSAKHLREVKRGILRLSVMQERFQVPSKDSSIGVRSNPFTSTHPLVLSSSGVTSRRGGGRGEASDAMPIKRAGSNSDQRGLHNDDKMQLDPDDEKSFTSDPKCASSSATATASVATMDTSHSFVENNDGPQSDGEDDDENDE